MNIESLKGRVVGVRNREFGGIYLKIKWGRGGHVRVRALKHLGVEMEWKSEKGDQSIYEWDS